MPRHLQNVLGIVDIPNHLLDNLHNHNHIVQRRMLPDPHAEHNHCDHDLLYHSLPCHQHLLQQRDNELLHLPDHLDHHKRVYGDDLDSIVHHPYAN